MDQVKNSAPGAPGIHSPWTSGAKTGIGRAANETNTVSFTIGRGVLNEVYYPQEDIACMRECIFLVADGKGYFSDERCAMRDIDKSAGRGIPAFLIRNRCPDNGYVLDKEIVADIQRSAVLQRVRFNPSLKGLQLYVALTPHLHNQGANNESWIARYKDMEMIFAACEGLAVAMACSTGWEEATVGFIGVSDGHADLQKNKKFTRLYDYAGWGNTQLCARPVIGEEMVIAIGFGLSPAEAAFNARSSLLEGFASVWNRYVKEWKAWQRKIRKKWRGQTVEASWLPESIAALRIAESRRYPGGIIASLSIPWGQSHGVNGGLGYHLVWPRDLVESAWGFLALNAKEEVLRILNYLFTTQDGDGKWAQNMWLDGRPCLPKIQMDQVALPILLLYSCYHRGLFDREGWLRYRPGLYRAAAYLLEFGPSSEQDRWEQQSGLSTFSLAAQIAALISAAELLERTGDIPMAEECRKRADLWNAQIETWTFVEGTDTAHRCGVRGYYVRVNPFLAPAQDVKEKPLRLHHHPEGKAEMPVGEVVSVDALALVRFGLRRADDPRILDTIRVIDSQLRRDLPEGPCWRRFTYDGYGETDTGDPLGEFGTGRCWPLLTGERAHYEIAAGHFKEASKLLKAMESFSHNGLFPEQVWDAADIPEKDLYRGRYTGSAMPLTWAQAEYIKLTVSLRQQRVFDLPSAAAKRYLKE
ncbi:MAG: glucan 1,4-alpha-glucosidase [Bacteroidetes bacterium]|nr:glucan 1,4-alpha-glucosidase [Bacteroidota bacterium]